MNKKVYFKDIVNENEDFRRISKQSKFTKDAPYLNRRWKSGVLEGLFVGRTLVGFLWYNIAKRKNYMKLYYIAVDETKRGNGYGRICMERLFDICNTRKVDYLTFLVEKDNPSVDFYKKFPKYKLEEKSEKTYSFKFMTNGQRKLFEE